MEWPKLKNIILIILAVTNLCLLVFVVRQELRDGQLRRQARADAIAFLEGKGIQVAEDQVPHTMTLLPQTVERDLEAEGTAAAALLKGNVWTESRGGGAYRYYNENGSIQFHSDGAFSAEFAPGAFPLGEDKTAGGLALLEQLGFQGELTGEAEGQLTFCQLWEGVPLFSQQVTLVYEGDCLTAMTSGRRLIGQPEEDPARTVITVPTALIEFFNGLNTLGDVCSRIDTITQGYISVASLSGPAALNPVWRITTDTGAYQMDLLTGALSRAA